MILLGLSVLISLIIVGVVITKEGINESIRMNDPDDNERTEDET